MPELKKCRTCGVDIQSNAPFGHCPQCLLAMGFGPIPKEVVEPPVESAASSPPAPLWLKSDPGPASASQTGPALFEQNWAMTVIASVLERLRKDYADAGKARLFEAIQSHLSGDDGADTYAAMAAKLNMTEGAVKIAVLRLRENFRHRLRAVIAQTVADPGEIDDELRHLFACLSR